MIDTTRFLFSKDIENEYYGINPDAIKECCRDNVRFNNPSTNKSGFPGVRLQKSKWQAYITTNGRNIYLGSFDNKEDAIMARLNAEIKYLGHPKYKVYEQFTVQN